MAVLTPSIRADYDLCAGLNRSVLEYSPPSVEHHIVVPRRDLARFDHLSGPRTRVHSEAGFLPRSFVRLPLGNATVNLGRPFPPVRGWILQQIVKLAAAASLDADVVVLVDSDIEFIRPFTAETFLRNGVVRFYRQPGEVDERLPRHVVWHRTARALLGLPPAAPPYPDYVSSLLAWDPRIVRSMLSRVAQATGCAWPTAVARELHFSEWTLYGVFVENVLDGTAKAFASNDALCLTYWDEVPLDERGAIDYASRLRPTDIAAMISAKSNTPMAVRRTAFDRLRAVTSGIGRPGEGAGHP